MVKKFTANGARIKELRTGSLVPLPQKVFSENCGISERQLRRIENNNQSIELSLLQRIATVLKVGVGEITYGAQRPTLVIHKGAIAPPPRLQQTRDPETIVIPRHTTAHLRPILTAQALYESARDTMEIVPHLLVDMTAAQMAMIHECLALLKAVSDRQWSHGEPLQADAHDSAPFPEVSRRARLAELFVLIKGNDIRIVAERETYHYPTGVRPWLAGEKFCFQLIIGFAPPRGEYEEEYVVVPFDAGREVVLPSKVIF